MAAAIERSALVNLFNMAESVSEADRPIRHTRSATSVHQDHP